MIPGGKLTDRWGRKRCFIDRPRRSTAIGALISAASPGLGVLILGNSILEGIGTALLIPPVYILTTMLFHDLTSRARAFGIITRYGRRRRRGRTAHRWTHHHRDQLAGGVRVPGDRHRDHHLAEPARSSIRWPPIPTDPSTSWERSCRPPVWSWWCGRARGRQRSRADRWRWSWPARRARRVLRGTSATRTQRAESRCFRLQLFRNRTSNLGLVTQNVQWLLLMGTAFVVSAYLQVVRGYNAIQTGVIFTAATGGILVSSLAAERLAKRYSQRTLIVGGLRHDHRRRRRAPRLRQQHDERMGVRTRASAHRTRSRRDAHAVGERRAIRVPRSTNRARSPACRAASPISGLHSAPPSREPSSSPASTKARTPPR